MPWLHAQVGRLLDRMWFGREFTPVEAVKHVLSAMQPATDEAALVAATEAALSEIFGARIVIRLADQPPPDERRRVDRSPPAGLGRARAARGAWPRAARARC